MGFLDGLKELYCKGEEKWYHALDKLDASNIPVYKVIDPIDKVVPSFALALVILLLIIILLLIFFFGGFIFNPQNVTLSISVVDMDDKQVEGALVTVEIPGQETLEFDTDAYGMVPDLNVPRGANVKVTAEKKGNLVSLQKVMSDEINYMELTIPFKDISFEGKTLIFIDTLARTISNRLDLSFSCSSADAVPPQNQVVTTGRTTVNKPSNCTIMNVTISSSGKYKQKTVQITLPSTTITLEDNVPEGTSKVLVHLRYAGATVQESITVKAFYATNLYSTDYVTTSSAGEASFNLPPGEYYIRTETSNSYGKAESAKIVVDGKTPVEVTLNLEKKVVGILKIITLYGTTKLSDVEISVRLKSGGDELYHAKTDTNGTVLVNVQEYGPFIILASKEGYCPLSRESLLTTENIEMHMSRSTGNCGSTLLAQVVDDSGKPVPYAKAMIFVDNNEGTFKSGYAEKVTDYNGEAKWTNIPESTGESLKVFAYKVIYSGWSEARKFNSLNATTPFIVKLQIPYGTVNVNVKDADGNPVRFAEIALYDNYAQDLVRRDVTDEKGYKSFDVKGDKKVYAVVKADGFDASTTLPTQVIGNGIINFDVTLNKHKVGSGIDVSFVGLYKDGVKTINVRPGEIYDAVFSITAPKEYDELGFFARVGAENISKTELDDLFIQEIEVPGKAYTEKGATYNPPKGYNRDSEALGMEESKWAQAKWFITAGKLNYAPGKILARVRIKIKNTARLDMPLELWYRAWGVENGAFERMPLDDVLGTARNSSSKQELYAKAIPYSITTGDEQQCAIGDDNIGYFCTSASYTDEEGFTQSFDSGFDAKNNANYAIKLVVRNDSTDNKANYEKAEAQWENVEENIYMSKYYLDPPHGNSVEGSVDGFKSEWLSVDRFDQGSEIKFHYININPQKSGIGLLKFSIRNIGRMIYTKPIAITILSNKKLRAEYMVNNEFQSALPSIPSGKEEFLTVKVFNKDTSVEVSGAIVKLYDRFGTVIYSATTNSLGTATITIPASLPGEKLKIQIEKSDYDTLEQKFSISEDIVTVNPDNVSYTLNPQTMPEEAQTVVITNQTGMDLTIKEILFSGKLKGLINEAKVKTFLQSYVGKVIKSNDSEEIQLKVVLASYLPEQGEDLEGKFEIIVGITTKDWVKEVPAKIRIGLGKDVDDPNCLVAVMVNNPWITNTAGRKIEAALEIRNQCLVEGKPVPLKNLGVKLDMSSNSLGMFRAQSRSASVEINKIYPRILRPEIGEEEVIPITLLFTPQGGANGTMTGKVIFEAKNTTDSKDQVVTTSIDFTINVTNLQDCIIIGKDLIEMDEEGEEGFVIKNNCPSDATISLKSEIALSNADFTIPAGGEQEVNIVRNLDDMPGAYNLLVYGSQKGIEPELIGNVKVIFNSTGCYTLSRYEFDIYDSELNDSTTEGGEPILVDGIDKAYLRNNCTQKAVPVYISGEEETDWTKVLLQALIGGLGGFAGCYMQEGATWSDCLFSPFGNPFSGDEDKNGSWFKENGNISENIENGGTAGRRGVATAGSNATGAVAGVGQRTSNVLGESEDQLKRNEEFYAKLKADSSMTGGIDPGAIAVRQDETRQVRVLSQDMIGTIETSTARVIDNIKGVTSKELQELRAVEQQLNEAAKREEIANKDIAAEYAAALDGSETAVGSAYSEGVDEIIDESNKAIEAQIASLEELNKRNRQVADAIRTIPELQPNLLELEENIKATEERIADLKNFLDNVEEVPPTETVTSSITQATPPATESGSGVGEDGDQTRWTYVKVGAKDDLPEELAGEQYTAGTEALDKRTINSIEQEINRLNEAIIFAETKKASATDPWFINEYDITISANKIRIAELQNYLSDKSTQTAIPLELINPTPLFLLAGSQDGASKSNSGGLSGGLNSDSLGSMVMSGVGGFMTKSPIIGAALAALMEIMQQQDQEVQYNMTLGVERVNTKKIELVSPSQILAENKNNKETIKDIPMTGLKLIIGKTSYDYDSTGQTPSFADATATQSFNSPYDSSYDKAQSSGYFYNPQTLSATLGLVQINELTFINEGTASGGKLKTDGPYAPIAGVLKVTGEEKIYETNYDYLDMKDSIGGDEDDGIFDKLFGSKDYFDISKITEENLIIKEKRNYVQKFHLLFDAWDYVGCGPDTYPCQDKPLANCTVGGKQGSTGPEAAPNILLQWGWDKINADKCDLETSDSVYCDTTQFSISTLKKIYEIKQFLNSHALDNCPKAIDVAGAKSQKLKANARDVGITYISMSETTENVYINATVESNNDLNMSAEVEFVLSREDSTNVEVQCEEGIQSKSFISGVDFQCTLTKASLGSGGRFNVEAIMTPAPTRGTENADTSNDTITTMLLVDGDQLQYCKAYNTKKDYFEEVLAANGALDTQGRLVLKYLVSDVKLVKDGFSNDFKQDFDAERLLNAPQYYNDDLREIFLSERFEIIGPDGTPTWKAGTYSTTIVITFSGEKFEWFNDNNNIESIKINLTPLQGNRPLGEIYNIAFDGPVGINSSNGRQGYGSDFVNNSDKDFIVSVENGSQITAQENPTSNAISNVGIDVKKDFYSLNDPYQLVGNVLTIQGTGDNISLIMSPSVVVPLILNVTRRSDGASEPHAYYSVEVGGKPQDMGESFIHWLGIGQGCVDFLGIPMMNYDRVAERAEAAQITNSYGFNWPNATRYGTVSMHGVIFAPALESTILKITSQADSADFETLDGKKGPIVTVDASSTKAIESLQDIMDKIKNEEICVLDTGDYFWNTLPYLEQLNIDAKEATCIAK